MNYFRERSLDNMAERIFLTSLVTGAGSMQIAQEIFLGLPQNHYLLRNHVARRDLQAKINDLKSDYAYEKKYAEKPKRKRR